MVVESDNKAVPIFRDIRRYYCEYCGICRSKKSLITSHVLSTHKEGMEEQKLDKEDERSGLNVCDDCGAVFKKPAHLKQHMQSHSLERPFICPVDDCSESYRRKDHLNRHLLTHKEKLFKCPIEDCNIEFTIKANIARHLKYKHDGNNLSSEDEDEVEKNLICSEIGCGKKFQYESRLKKHMESHVKLDSVEVFCADPSCMKPFSNTKCLNAHIRSCHQHVTCEICGSKHLRKNIKRHLRAHEDHSSGEIKCTFEECDHTFTTKSNLQQHITAVHLELKPYVCSLPGCGKRFTYKHVRDNHEKSSCHSYVHGDLEEFDEQFLSRPSRGGVKRSCPTIDSLMRKRVVPLSNSDTVMTDGANYMSWLLSSDNEDQI